MRRRQAPFPHPTTWLVIIALGFLGPLDSHREFFPLTGSGGFLLLAQVLVISAGMGAPSEVGRSKRNQSREFVSKFPPSSKGWNGVEKWRQSYGAGATAPEPNCNWRTGGWIPSGAVSWVVVTHSCFSWVYLLNSAAAKCTVWEGSYHYLSRLLDFGFCWIIFRVKLQSHRFDLVSATNGFAQNGANEPCH